MRHRVYRCCEENIRCSTTGVAAVVRWCETPSTLREPTTPARSSLVTCVKQHGCDMSALLTTGRRLLELDPPWRLLLLLLLLLPHVGSNDHTWNSSVNLVNISCSNAVFVLHAAEKIACSTESTIASVHSDCVLTVIWTRPTTTTSSRVIINMRSEDSV